MKLTTKGRYAVMAMADLASNANVEPTSLSEISSRQNISLRYLEQIFIKLKNKKLVKSSRGAAGGVTNGSRGVIAGGYDTANLDTQEYITIGTLGNSTDSNELSQARQVGNYGNLSGD